MPHPRLLTPAGAAALLFAAGWSPDAEGRVLGGPWETHLSPNGRQVRLTLDGRYHATLLDSDGARLELLRPARLTWKGVTLTAPTRADLTELRQLDLAADVLRSFGETRGVVLPGGQGVLASGMRLGRAALEPAGTAAVFPLRSLRAFPVRRGA